VAIWLPPVEVGEKEVIGRRLLDRPSAQRAKDGNGLPVLDVDDFYERRKEADLSVDRLGDPNPGQDTLRAVTSLADNDASRPEVNRVFNGWTTIRVRDLRFPGWIARSFRRQRDEKMELSKMRGMPTSVATDFGRKLKPMR
jgi:hypothetical protein